MSDFEKYQYSRVRKNSNNPIDISNISNNEELEDTIKLDDLNELNTNDSGAIKKVGSHVKKGLSGFQKTVAFIGSILSVIVASITISNNLKPKEDVSIKPSETKITHIYKNQSQSSTSSSNKENKESTNSDTSSKTSTQATNSNNQPTKYSSNYSNPQPSTSSSSIPQSTTQTETSQSNHQNTEINSSKDIPNSSDESSTRTNEGVTEARMGGVNNRNGDNNTNDRN